MLLIIIIFSPSLPWQNSGYAPDCPIHLYLYVYLNYSFRFCSDVLTVSISKEPRNNTWIYTKYITIHRNYYKRRKSKWTIMKVSKHHTRKSNITRVKFQNHERNSCKTWMILYKFKKMKEQHLADDSLGYDGLHSV